VVIDMQRDFVEPGGFGASLGNDVTLLQAHRAPVAAVLAAWRRRGGPVLHTREATAPDLSDCPPAKRDRGNPSCASAMWGRWAAAGGGRAGQPEIIPALARCRANGDRQARQGRLLGHGLHERLQGGHHAPGVHRRDHRGLRADQHARGQRPRLRPMPDRRGRHRELLPRVQAAHAGDDRAHQGGIVGWQEGLVDQTLLDQLAAIWLVPAAERSADRVQVGEWDEAFHCALVAAAGNAEVARVHRDVTERIRIIRRLDFTKPARIDATYDEHAKILRAVQRKRADQAAMLLRAHIETSQAEVRKITLHQVHLARQAGAGLK
jgi:hypothetical protein